MSRIGIYTDRRVFAAGLEHTIAPSHQLDVVGLQAIQSAPAIAEWDPPPGILIVDAPPEAAHLIQSVRNVNPEIPCVVWERVAASEPALNALGSGVQGVLLDNSPPEDVMTCMEAVLSGGIWVPPSISLALVSSQLCKLTRRESQLVSLVAQGLRNKEIAYSLGISEGTVKVYLCRLFDKLGVGDRYELALLALRHGGPPVQAPVPAGTPASAGQCSQSLYIPRKSSRWTQGTRLV